MAATRKYRCPACRADFRGTPHCSRCGADLAPLMRLAAAAHRDREGARERLRHGDHAAALDLAARAQARCVTPQGARLLLLARWMAEG